MITIPKRPLGNTGLQISVLGFGASPLGGVFHDVDAEEGKKAVRLAFERGVNFFDTSPFYGDKRSEIALGRAIADLPRSEIVVATKVGRYGAETFDFSAERVRKSVDESLERLGLEVIDLIQCHDMEFVCLDQIVNETLPALLELKRQGKVRFVGITGLPLKIFKDVLDRAPAGSVDCVLSYCHYTMLDDTLDGLIPYLQSKNVGIINASPLCMGLLTRRGPPSWHPAPQEVLDAARRATAAADETGLDIANVALQFSLKNEKIATTLVGMCTPQQVEENCSAALRALGIDSGEGAMYEEVTGRVTEILGAVHNVTWHSGLPENN
jgi:L-galactose dehydrogenase